MSLSQFVNSLFHEGRARVDPIFDRHGTLLIESPRELDAAAQTLESFEIDYRRELAHAPPGLSRPAMLWGARCVRRAASLLSYREIDADRMRSNLAEPCPEPPTASVVYSVDLCLRFLPDLMRLARAASPDDPLVAILKLWGEQWPLSSVGMAVTVSGPLDWLSEPCLRQLYVDRIVAEQDESRLADEATRQAVRQTLGRHHQLAPKLASHLAAKYNV